MDKLNQISRIICDMERLRLDIKHDDVEISSKLFTNIYNYGCRMIWEAYSGGEWYGTPVYVTSDGEPQSFEDWYDENFRKFPSFMSADDFREIFDVALQDRYAEECRKAVKKFEQEQAERN